MFLYNFLYIQIVEIDISKTGKHGGAKAGFTGLDIFTSKKYEEIAMTQDTLDEVVVVQKWYTLVDIQDDGFLSLMDDEGNMRYDLCLPDETLFKGLASRIKTKFEMGQNALVVVM